MPYQFLEMLFRAGKKEACLDYMCLAFVQPRPPNRLRSSSEINPHKRTWLEANFQGCKELLGFK